MLKSINNDDKYRQHAAKEILDINNEPAEELSIFETAWKSTAGDQDKLSLARIYDLLGMIESQTMTQKYLTNDLFIASKVSTIISKYEQERDMVAGDILVSKLEMANLMKHICQHINVVDYTTPQPSRIFDYKYRYYEENDHNVIMQRSRISILNSNSSEPEEASDEDAISLMDNTTYRKHSSSPTSFLDSESNENSPLIRDRVFSGFKVKQNKLCIGDVLNELNEFHEQIHYRFKSFDFQINMLKAQNQNDLKTLQTITSNNDAIISRVHSIQNDLIKLNQEFNLVKDEKDIPIDNEQHIYTNDDTKQDDVNIIMLPMPTSESSNDGQKSNEIFFYSVVFLTIAIIYKIILFYF